MGLGKRQLTDNNGSGGSNVSGFRKSLSHDDRYLQGEAVAKPRDHLVANPSTRRCANIQSVEQSSTDRHKDRPSQHIGCRVARHCEDARRDARCVDARDGVADNQRRRVLGDGGDEAAKLNDEDGDEEAGLEGEVLEDLAPGELERAEGHEVGRAVAGDVVEAVELVGDSGNGSCDDGLGC